ISLGDHVGAEDGAGAALVLDDDGLAQALARLLGDNARHAIGPAARRVRHHELYRLAWVIGRAGSPPPHPPPDRPHTPTAHAPAVHGFGPAAHGTGCATEGRCCAGPDPRPARQAPSASGPSWAPRQSSRARKIGPSGWPSVTSEGKHTRRVRPAAWTRR